MNDFPIENYKDLACAIVKQAVTDYKENRMSARRLYIFLTQTTWIKYLNIDVQWLFEKVVKEKTYGKKNKKSIGRMD